MSFRHCALAGLLCIVLPSLQAASPGVSFDELNAVALSHHPDSMVSDVQLQTGNDGRQLYKAELRDAQGIRRQMVLDATSRTLLWEDERQMHSIATLPLGWIPGEKLPSFDQLNRLALQHYPGGRVIQASLRRIGDGRLLYDLLLKDGSDVRHQMVIESTSLAVLTNRRAD